MILKIPMRVTGNVESIGIKEKLKTLFVVCLSSHTFAASVKSTIGLQNYKLRVYKKKKRQFINTKPVVLVTHFIVGLASYFPSPFCVLGQTNVFTKKTFYMEGAKFQ
jgi:hypothetical protein